MNERCGAAWCSCHDGAAPAVRNMTGAAQPGAGADAASRRGTPPRRSADDTGGRAYDMTYSSFMRSSREARIALARWAALSAIVIGAGGCEAHAHAPNSPCSEKRGERVCCPSTRRVAAKVITTSPECERDTDCATVARLTLVDYQSLDVVIASPAVLGLQYSSSGPPTTLGDEWHIHEGITVQCDTQGRQPFVLQSRVDAGGGSVVYAAAVPKLDGRSVLCSCGNQ